MIIFFPWRKKKNQLKSQEYPNSFVLKRKNKTSDAFVYLNNHEVYKDMNTEVWVSSMVEEKHYFPTCPCFTR